MSSVAGAVRVWPRRCSSPSGILLVLAATESAAQSAPPGFSARFRVSGRISHPTIYRVADLQALPAHTVNVSFEGPGGVQSHQFTGALLSDIETAAGGRYVSNVNLVAFDPPRVGPSFPFFGDD